MKDLQGMMNRSRTATPDTLDQIVFRDVSDKNRVKRATLNDAMRLASSAGIAAGSALTLTLATHGGKRIFLDTAAGSTVTLPASTGSGATYTFVVSVLATSNSHIIKVANVSDAMQGYIFTRDDTADAANAFFATAGTSDTITLNRTTTGSVVIGEVIRVIDIALNKFQVEGFIANSGTPATPFSATV